MPRIIAILSLMVMWSPHTSATEPRKPNIILIYSDDHGWADLGIQGVDKDIRTPNFDQLARDGVRFTRGYVTAPQCVPSRAGVLTGRYQQRFGVEDNNKGPLPLVEKTIAERLKVAGYATGMSGKWHLDLGPGKEGSKAARVLNGHMPHAQGFDEYWRGELRQYYASHDLKGVPFADAPRLVVDNRFRVVVQTDAALSFLDRRLANSAQPWFLYLAWYAPHVPLESPEPWFSRTPEHLPLKRRQALAMIAAMDEGLGTIRRKIKEAGQEDNTLVFFIGDNGAPLGAAWDGSMNSPQAGQKGMLSEGGIRVPFVASWPATIPRGKVFDQPVISLDVAATCIAAAGLPPDPALDGVDLVPFLRGERKSPPHERLFWRWGSQAAVLEMPYKLVALGDRERLLFDVTQPDGEHHSRNLAGKQPEVARRLAGHLKAWSGGLKPPGLPVSLDRHHEGLFAEHGILAPGQSASSGSTQGWQCRNGTLLLGREGLEFRPEADLPKNSKVFLTHSGLNIGSPAVATIRMKSPAAGKASLTWRTREESFGPGQAASFDWPASMDWVEVKVNIPEKNRIIHVRLVPPTGAKGSVIGSIEFRGADGSRQSWNFAK